MSIDRVPEKNIYVISTFFNNSIIMFYFKTLVYNKEVNI